LTGGGGVLGADSFDLGCWWSLVAWFGELIFGNRKGDFSNFFDW
jgi:hypothetical protein